MIKKVIETFVKILRIDNGFKFYSEEFNTYYKDHEMVRHKIIYVTSQ